MSEEIKHNNKVIGQNDVTGWVNVNIENDECLRHCGDWLQSQPNAPIRYLRVIFRQNFSDNTLAYKDENMSLLLNYLKCNDTLRSIHIFDLSIIPNDDRYNICINPILKSIGNNPNIVSVFLEKINVSDDTFENLMQNNISLKNLAIYECNLAYDTSSRTSNLRQQTLDRITQSFHNNHSLYSVQFDVSHDIDLATAIVKGLTGHNELNSIFLSEYLEHNDLFSKILQNMIMGTESLQKLELNQFIFSYNILLPLADSIMNTNSKSHITEIFLYECSIVVECHNTIDILHRVLTTSSITKLVLGDDSDENEFRITSRAFLSMIANDSNLSVLSLLFLTEAEDIQEENEEENEDHEVEIIENEEEIDINEYLAIEAPVIHEIPITEFWETLTMNKTLQFLSTPPMGQHDIQYAPFIQSVPKLNVRGLQLNIYNPPNHNNNTSCCEFLDAFKNNFSLFYVHINGWNDMNFNSHSIDKTIAKKIEWYCTRNVALDHLSSHPYKDKDDEEYRSHDELVKIDDAYALVQPLPDVLWSTLLYTLNECDTQYKYQAIFRCLNYGMIESIGKCKTNYKEMLLQEAEE